MLARRRCARRRGVSAFLAIAVVGAAGGAVDAQVTLLNSFGSAGSGNGQLNFPVGISADSFFGRVFVADNFNNRVDIFTPTGGFISSLGSVGSGAGQFIQPLGVAVNPLGNAFAVSDTVNSRIQIFNLTTQQYAGTIGSFGSGAGQLSNPQGVAYVPGLVYVADTQNNRLEAFHSDGSLYFTVDHQDGPAMNHPDGVAADPVSGDVFVADSGNNEIQAFTSNGGGLGVFSGSGQGYSLNLPKSLAVSQTHRLYVTDLNNNRVVVLQESGTLITTFNVSQPAGVTVGDSGLVYVTSNNSVQRFLDPASWFTGSNVFTDATVGPTSVAAGTGQILGANLNLTTGKGLIAGGTVSVLGGGSIALTGGSLSTTILAPNAAGAIFTFSSGTLAAQQINVGNGGAFVATAGGSINASTQFSVSNAGSSGSFDGGVQLTTPVCAVFGGLLKVGSATINTTGPVFLIAPLYIGSGAELQLTNATNSVLKGAALQNGGTLDGAGQIQAQLLNQSTGVILPAPGNSLTFTGAANTSSGTITLSGGTIHFAEDFTSTGTINAANGDLVVDGGFTNSGDIESVTGAQFYGAVHNASNGVIHSTGVANTFHGMFTNDGTVNCASGVEAFLGGYIGPKGVGGAGRVTLDQSISTGPMPGSISFGGSVLLLSTGVLHMRLTGATPDQINITGTGTLAGTISVEQYNGALPLPGQSFVVMTYGNEVGDISISNQTGRAGLRFVKTLGATSLSLAVSGLSGDDNLDGVVNSTDFNTLAADFNTGSANWLGGDFNGDGLVNALDFSALADHFGELTPAQPLGALVPEPAAAALALIVLAARRRRVTCAAPSAGA